MIKKYISKPNVVEAVLWDGKEESTIECFIFMGLSLPTNTQQLDDFIEYCTLNGWTMVTNKGCRIASIGNYIIKDENGDFYPCDSKTFKSKYDEFISD